MIFKRIRFSRSHAPRGNATVASRASGLVKQRPAGAQAKARSHISKQAVHCGSGSYPRQTSHTLLLVPTLCFLVPTLRVGTQLPRQRLTDCLNLRPAGAQAKARSHISKQALHCGSGSYPRQASHTLTLIGRVGTAHQSHCRLLTLVTSFINY